MFILVILSMIIHLLNIKVIFILFLVREQIGKGKRAFTAYGRQKMFTQKMAD